jgi:hypothetical protein
MDHSRKCMSIHAIVDANNATPSHEDIPLSPPDSFKSRSPSLSPRIDYMTYSSNNSERRNSFQLPMSVEERRYRNKLASAKYRAKKVLYCCVNLQIYFCMNFNIFSLQQASMKTMTTKVSQLMTSNTNLQRELSKVKQENEVLRAMLLAQQQASAPSTPPQQHYQPPLSY